MKESLFIALLFSVMLVVGCGNAAAPVQSNSSTVASHNSNERSQNMITHSTENQPPTPVEPSSERTKWSQSGNPIDTAELDAAVSNAQKIVKSAPSLAATKTLADAYFRRGFALTEARQYASALGDYRKAVKLDPSNADAKQWIDQIQKIYDTMNKEAPKEGEEPPPLPFKKGQEQK
jgi:tetratricopeptide (TPR) repeat protein